VCNTLVAGGRPLGVEQQAMRPGWGKLCAVSSSWWWAYECPKHV